MDNSSLNATEIAVGSLLAGGNRGGGGGAWDNGYNGRPFADDGSNAVRINRNNDIQKVSNECNKDIFTGAINNFRDSFENLNRANQFSDLKDGQFRLELRTNDNIAAIREQMSKDAAAAALCCCKLESEIKASEGRAIERDLNKANAELIALKTQVACGCVSGCSTPCTQPS